MYPRIKKLVPIEQYRLLVDFDDGSRVEYDVNDDINTLPGYSALKTIYGLFQNVHLDESRTCVYWNQDIDLPSDIIYEYGKPLVP